MSEAQPVATVDHRKDCGCDACTKGLLQVLMDNLCWNPDPFCGCPKHNRTRKEVRQ